MNRSDMTVKVGCAGWAIPRQHAHRFPEQGTHLERYARRLPAVEINSSFYRSYQPKTYARWAASVPEHFRFAVKVPREITHRRGHGQRPRPAGVISWRLFLLTGHDNPTPRAGRTFQGGHASPEGTKKGGSGCPPFFMVRAAVRRDPIFPSSSVFCWRRGLRVL